VSLAVTGIPTGVSVWDPSGRRTATKRRRRISIGFNGGSSAIPGRRLFVFWKTQGRIGTGTTGAENVFELVDTAA